MKYNVITKEEIIEKCLVLIRNQGWQSFNIRKLAEECNISTGTVYNYFDSKTSLLVEVVENVWDEIFDHGDLEFDDILGYVDWIFSRIQYGNEKYSGFFRAHSSLFSDSEKNEAKIAMVRMWKKFRADLVVTLQKDRKVDLFSKQDQESVEKMINIILSMILASIVKQDYDPELTRYTIIKILH